MSDPSPPVAGAGASQTSTTSTSTSTSTSTPSPDDQLLYNWSTFFNILTNRAPPAEREAYFRVRDTLHEASDIARADSDKAWLFANSPIIRFMRHNIQLLGHDINETNVRCRRCETRQSGGFDPEYGILICANQLRNRGHLEDTMAHEMVHAWDYLRFQYNDPKDLRHAACTEVRSDDTGHKRVLMCGRFERRRFRESAGLEGSSSRGDSGTSHSNSRSVSGGGLRCQLPIDRLAKTKRMRRESSTRSGRAVSMTRDHSTRSTDERRAKRCTIRVTTGYTGLNETW